MGRVGNFWMLNGYFYRGPLLEESETHYKIRDFKTGAIFELLKNSVEKVKWEGE